MSQSVPEAEKSVGTIRKMPYGIARTQVAESTARRIETEGPAPVLAYSLFTLVESYVWGAEEAKAYVPFQKMIRLWDTSPELFDSSDRENFFWAFKWMVGGLKDHPGIPASQITATLADMERRYAVAGNGMDAVAYCAFTWANHSGDPDVALAFDAWVATPRDEFSQCEACSIGDEAEYFASTGRLEQAVQHIRDVPPTTRWCATEPADMLSVQALAEMELGRPQDAAVTHRRAAAALESAESDMGAARGRGLELLMRSGQLERGLEWLQRDGVLLTAADSPLGRLRYLRHVVAALADLPEQDLAREIAFTTVPVTTLGELRGWADAAAVELAAAFDARNGTDRHSQIIEQARLTRRFTEGLDLSVIRLTEDPALASVPASSARASSAQDGSGPDDPFVAAGSSAPAPLTVGDEAATDGATAGATGSAATESADAAPQSWRETLGSAERTAGAGDLHTAASLYLTAATGAQAAGELAEAGFGYAEAARCAQQLGDVDGAHQAYLASLLRLRAGGVTGELLVQVLAAWAPAAASPARAEPYLEQAALVLADLAGVDLASIEDDRLRARREESLTRSRAVLDDATARVIASAPGVASWTERDAAQLAADAAELFAKVGDIGDASHAFWVAGRIWRSVGDEEQALWCLESAVEGFGITGARTDRGEAANELVTLLRASGNDARADEIIASLGG